MVLDQKKQAWYPLLLVEWLFIITPLTKYISHSQTKPSASLELSFSFFVVFFNLYSAHRSQSDHCSHTSFTTLTFQALAIKTHWLTQNELLPFNHDLVSDLGVDRGALENQCTFQTCWYLAEIKHTGLLEALEVEGWGPLVYFVAFLSPAENSGFVVSLSERWYCTVYLW